MGPLLFLIFINDISKSSSLFKFILFADDSTLSVAIPNNMANQFGSIINSELNLVHDWLIANKINVNTNKTKYMIFSYKSNEKLPEIKIGTNIIEQTDETKFLGVYLDQHLTFKKHSCHISTKVSKSIGILYKLNKYLPPNILKNLYFTLVHPYLSYAIEAWHSAYNNVTKKIFVLQKKAIRAVNNLEYNSHTNDFFKSMNILKLEDQYKLQVAIYMYKTVNNDDFDDDLKNSIILHSEVHNHNTRNSNIFIINKFNKNKSKFSIQYNGPKIWNSLPLELSNKTSISSFKGNLQNNFVNLY